MSGGENHGKNKRSYDINDQLQTLFSSWHERDLNGQPALLKTFTQGLNHQTHLVESANTRLVVKLFNFDNHREAIAHSLAAQVKLAPQIQHYDAELGVLITDYIPSSNLVGKDLSANEISTLAESLNKVHQVQTNAYMQELSEFNIIEFCKRYIADIEQDKKRVLGIHTSLEPILQKYVSDATPKRFCHNDLVLENCFLHNDQALFIDWEFSQVNNPWFDLAAIIYYAKLSTRQSDLLLKKYNRRFYETRHEDIFYTSQCALLWGDILWHIAKRGWQAWPNLDRKLNDLSALAQHCNVTVKV